MASYSDSYDFYYYRYTARMRASDRGHLGVVEALLNHGSNKLTDNEIGIS
jgi:hypothetical protein